MAIELKMPALSPTMEEGTLAKWLKSEGDTIEPGDIIAEIETDKATMEFEAIDEGTLAKIMVEEGTENVAVGTVIAELPADKGGFVAGIERVIDRERTLRGIEDAQPVLLQLREGNRLSLTDPATGWSAELMGFGATNTRTFARLLDQPKP